MRWFAVGEKFDTMRVEWLCYLYFIIFFDSFHVMSN